MIRFVRDPSGRVVPDIAGKLPGRGVWVTATREAVTAAAAGQVFSRRFKTKSPADPDLADAVERLLALRCIQLLGLSRRSGAIVSGFDQVRAALRKSRPGWLIEASDGSADGRIKVYSLAKALYAKVNVAGALSSVELGMAFGGRRVIHALLQPGPMSARWAADYRRLGGFRSRPEDHWFSAGDR